MKIWLASALLWTLPVLADVTVPVACEYAQTLHSPFSFREVEFINRASGYGLRHTEDVTLDPRVDVGENAWVGIDREGRLLNVTRVAGRTMAFLLSGPRRIRDFYYRPPTTLIALDDRGRLLQFDWRNGAAPSLTRRLATRAVKTAGATCVANGFVFLYALILRIPPTEFEIQMGALSATVASIGVQAFAELVEYGLKNQNTDGLRDLGVSVADFKRSDFARGAYGIDDYTLFDRRGRGTSLNALVADRLRPAARGYDADCAYALIPAGKNDLD